MPEAYVHVDPGAFPEAHRVEIVERKGVGHPDTLADGIAELASVRYSAYCLEHFGAVLHHNLDKVAVLGGLARFSWRDGAYARPLRIVFGGRASMCLGDTPVPVCEILEEAAAEYLRFALPGFAAIKLQYVHMTTDSSKHPHWFSPRGLEDLPERQRPFANDSAYVIGAAPRTTAENVALASEAFFREKDWTGTDIKALVVRDGTSYTVTVCVPALVGAFEDAAAYREAIRAARAQLGTLLSDYVGEDVNLAVNAKSGTPSDDATANLGYVALSGSAIDYGEDGLVGRGNSRTGLISPSRRHGAEVLFGKNPVYHVGKVYGIIADTVAATAARTGVACQCAMTTRIGAPLAIPATCSIITAAENDPQALRMIVSDALRRESWLDRLVTAREYVPRVYTLGELLRTP